MLATLAFAGLRVAELLALHTRDVDLVVGHLRVRVANTEAGVRTNVSVGIQYLASWLGGNGAAAINNLMEDAATAEISRSQIWQWLHHQVRLADGRLVTRALVQEIEADEMAQLRERLGADAFANSHVQTARELFDQVALSKEFVPFLTLPAYAQLD